MKTIRSIFMRNGEKIPEEKIVAEFIRHWAEKRNIQLTNEVAISWIEKYAERIRKHHESAVKEEKT